ncbi:hypothetical protein MRB53_021165 [Persea americana]|uniref:Uncharacterized protein n=1 Tax=Persea americana TaxID=3435 RepID=A0ACC2L3A0_PERAE|nr:hypothetical protein MRB53_021165 [Persea americana]
MWRRYAKEEELRSVFPFFSVLDVQRGCERGGDVQRRRCVSTCLGGEGELRKRRRSLAVEKKSFARRERESCEI